MKTGRKEMYDANYTENIDGEKQRKERLEGDRKKEREERGRVLEV